MSLNRLSNVLWERGAYAESRVYLEESAEILAAEPPGPELAECYASAASARILVGAFDEAIELSERALDLARRFDAGALISRALSYDPGGRLVVTIVTGTGWMTSPRHSKLPSRSGARRTAPSRCSSAPKSSGRTTDRP